LARLYHKDLPDGQNVIDVPDDEGTISVLEKSGWSTDVPKKHQSDAPANVAGPSEEA
jgi:hypothetical protein